VSDKKIAHYNANGVIDYYTADVVTANDYYPGGMVMPGRKYQAANGLYRFGFNGQEKDDEVSGPGNTNSALFWEYDTRLGRRWNLDPVVKAWESSYSCFSGNPIFFVDILGDNEGDFYTKDGKHLGNDNIDDNKAYVTDQETYNKNTNTANKKTNWEEVKKSDKTIDLTQKFGITNSSLLNRANWAYGESGGQLLSYYAHAINNLSKHGYSKYKAFKSDEDMYKLSMTHDANGNGKVDRPEECLYPGYFEGTQGSDYAKSFANARKTGSYTPIMEVAISETIKAKIGPSTSDPTHGAYQWAGGGLAERINNNTTGRFINKTFVEIDINGSKKGGVFKHLFYSYDEK
jgi:hypothetical protein